jgi:succinyl-diaminopimelate desuccinylase
MRDHVSRDSVVTMTQELVRVDSRNPPGDEREAAIVGRRLLEELGCECSTVEPLPGRVSVVGRLGACDGSRPTLIVNGHLDVVPINPDGWTKDPFAALVDDGRVWGRGTADMKGGIAAAIEAVRAVERAGVARPCDVVFHLVADEEQGGRYGTQVLSESGLIVGDACLVPEPTSLDVCIAERGVLIMEVLFHGRPAHASEPRNGISAIEKAAKVVTAVHGADFGHHHPLLGSTSANAGLISGGSGSNTVAERCLLTVDHRVIPGQTKDDAVDDVRRLIDRIDDPDLRYELNPFVFGEASELATDHPWVDQVQRSISAVRGRRAEVVGMTFATDARFVRNQAGIPAVVCGPGGISEAHRDDEFVEIDALVDAAAIYADLMAGFDEAAVGALRSRPLLAVRS